jgi:hypothetical protein
MSSAMASATLEPQSSVACMLPSTQTAGRASRGLRSNGEERDLAPSALLPIEETFTKPGCAFPQARNCLVSSA